MDTTRVPIRLPPGLICAYESRRTLGSASMRISVLIRIRSSSGTVAERKETSLTIPSFSPASHTSVPERMPGASAVTTYRAVSYTHLRAHETRHDLVCRLLLEKKKKNTKRH